MIQSGPCNNFLPDIAGPLPVSADVSIITLIHGSPVRPPGFHLVSCHPLQSFLYLDTINFATLCLMKIMEGTHSSKINKL